MRLRAEFTTEPFQGGLQDPIPGAGPDAGPDAAEEQPGGRPNGAAPPAHVTASADVLRAADLDCDMGPLGTSASGDSEVVYAALADVLRAAFSHGATRVTLQVERADDRP